MASSPGTAWPVTSPSSLLLGLPSHIRHRIYRHLGLTPWGSTPHRFFLHAGQLRLRRGQDFYESRFVPDPDSFHGLLLSCRAIHAEASALLYSKNQFILDYHRPHAEYGHDTTLCPLHTLHALTAPSLRCLSNLKIVLNQASCHHLTRHGYDIACCLEDGMNSKYWGIIWCEEKHQGRLNGHTHQLPLLTPDPRRYEDDPLGTAHAVLTEWQSTAHLLSNVAPGRLTFSLVCDIDPQHAQALEIANAILAPIHQLPPLHLRECHIRLAKHKHRQLEQLARDAISHACGIPTQPLQLPPTPKATDITLLTLPRELRLRILEHTDLVTPRRQVLWSRQDRAYAIYHFRTDPDDSPDHGYCNQFSDCFRNGSAYESVGCFCRRRHAAFSSTCKCWTPPGADPFLICRTLHHDAQFVFFSCNRFIIHDYKPSPPWVVPLLERHEHYAPDPIPTTPTPTTVSRPPKLVFPPYRASTWPGTHHPAMQDWASTVSWLRDKLNLPGLTVRLVVAEMDDGPESYYRHITIEEGATVMGAYMDLARPLRELTDAGLGRFHADLPYPHREWAYREKDKIKKQVEEFVMRERYRQLYANGREEPAQSDWCWRFYGQ
ncbi:hypothetical protein N657DRAFT_667179 [Parathielavia appendiculata]|uniref:F-box domain-containing protein n=1 Tax=Parathielavia appendiculata TaxID=2587402 RepID=A0AAN6TQT0_9PEZI|nr:hypothetical protein N657DRAFT_667179 [Parathielavia appendiculata]